MRSYCAVWNSGRKRYRSAFKNVGRLTFYSSVFYVFGKKCCICKWCVRAFRKIWSDGFFWKEINVIFRCFYKFVEYVSAGSWAPVYGNRIFISGRNVCNGTDNNSVHIRKDIADCLFCLYRYDAVFPYRYVFYRYASASVGQVYFITYDVIHSVTAYGNGYFFNFSSIKIPRAVFFAFLRAYRKWTVCTFFLLRFVRLWNVAWAGNRNWN